MNRSHLAYLGGPEWAERLRTELLPWLEETSGLGDDVLEVGPGPGLTTDLLRRLAGRVTAVEIDPTLAANLTTRLAGTNVEVIHGDAATIPLAPARFSAATCFSMLHHLESGEMQNRLFARLLDVLQPGAIFLGVDAIDSEVIRLGHVDDTYVPLDPATLDRRLRAAGFADITVTAPSEHQFRFTARKPPH